MGETSTCSHREASGRRALNFRETVPRRLLFGLLLSPTSLGTRFRSALDLASDRALESALESALARSARLSLALALKTLVHMSHAWQLALAWPCVYSVLSALSLMSGCMFRQLAIARPCVYSVYLSALGSPNCLAACSVLSLQSIVVHKSELLIHANRNYRYRSHGIAARPPLSHRGTARGASRRRRMAVHVAASPPSRTASTDEFLLFKGCSRASS